MAQQEGCTKPALFFLAAKAVQEGTVSLTALSVRPFFKTNNLGSRGSRLVKGMLKVCFKYTSSRIQACFKYASSVIHVCLYHAPSKLKVYFKYELLQICFKFASSRLQLGFK